MRFRHITATARAIVYAVGTSNGGYQVRRALETTPELYDGGVDWEGTYVDPVAPNILSALPPAILNFADYTASGFNPNSTAAKNTVVTGYPPDLVSGTSSLWGLYMGPILGGHPMPMAEAARPEL
jgi:hypothetical protein